MARPTIEVEGCIWKVYSPLGSKSTDASLAELTERQLLDFFHQSQPAWTSPEGGYRVR